MAEFCKDCFLKNCDAYDRMHIILSDEPDFCEECEQVKPVVLKIDTSELYPITDGKTLQKLFEKGLVRGCPCCGKLYTSSDAKAAAKDLVCPQCGAVISEIWTIRPVARIRRKIKNKIRLWLIKHQK